jgi:arylsulfatase A-like enzyme
MNRRNFLKKTALTAAVTAFSGRISLAQSVPSPVKLGAKPNFVFLFIDDMGYKDAGFMGSKYYETPNIDKLASQGMIFTSAYANAPNCAPSRACLMSGQYTPRHGIYTVSNPDRGPAHLRKLIPTPNKTVLNPDIITIPEALKPAGYTSASMGKWHLGEDPEAGPTAQGFDINVAGNHSGSPRGGYFSPYNNPNLTSGPKGEYLTDRLTDEAVKFIHQSKDKPFFLYLTHYAVHTPIQAKNDLTEKYKDKPGSNGHDNPKYAAMIDSMDQSVGRIMEALDELKIADNTVVVFFSDNGGYGPVTSMAPLKGAKGMLYEGGIREPMIVRWPAKVKPKSTCDTPVIGIDFFPTFLDIAGIAKPKDKILDGVSILPLLTSKGDLKREAIFWHFPAYLQKSGSEASGHGGLKGAKKAFRTTPASAVRQGDYKLIEFFEDNELELYNLKDDIGETTNLAKANPEKTKELHQLLKNWRKNINAPVPTEKNPKYNPDKPPTTKAAKKQKKSKNH